MKYDSFKYIFPPRPKNPLPESELDFWDNGSLIGQPKMNGSNCSIYTNGDKIFVYNRHNQLLTNFNINRDEILKLYTGNGWLLLNGEYLNKSKKDENNQFFNHKLIIFDILVDNSNHLIGSTFSERIEMLDNKYGKRDSDKSYLYSISDNVYRVKSYESGFKELYNNLIKIDMVEGLVCKKKTGKLEMGLTEDNTHRNQIKFRKPTKNYKF